MILWHNPRCSKSRQALALLEQQGADVVVRRYLDDPLSPDELRTVLTALGLRAIELMRVNEPEFRAMGLSRDDDDATLIDAMARAPKLIERPVLIVGDRAVIGRPPKRVLDLL
ncbi:arsenate reductase (glutaredoxin) [Thalassococcus sp. CAU 1522]|uniref:Arsenate reductase n=1 Tax=Thalassococcus arenae TaxID=2851652 RepID=A0ABS6N7S9_9RHOB|nr:arsenate reductase (glutaredoxin) [Thalassococcus arenae]MBV2360082.1 arsenate reductase (glutaredoxin) [Thalassococcus arenae]